MRTTINLDEKLIEDAQKLTGIEGQTALIHEGQRALIARERARRLAQLGESEPRPDVAPLRVDPKNRAPGRWKGRVQIARDFDAPLPASMIARFEGDAE